jgi:hypothetical protein
MGSSAASRSVFWFGEPGKRHQFETTLSDVDHGHQVIYERHLERRTILSLDEKPVLGRANQHLLDGAGQTHALDEHRQTDQVFGPILIFGQLSTLLHEKVQPTNLLGGKSIVHTFERDLVTAINATNRPHHVRTVLQEHLGARLNQARIFVLDIQAEEAVQPVGPAETPDDETLRLSRGIRRQR